MLVYCSRLLCYIYSTVWPSLLTPSCINLSLATFNILSYVYTLQIKRAIKQLKPSSPNRYGYQHIEEISEWSGYNTLLHNKCHKWVIKPWHKFDIKHAWHTWQCYTIFYTAYVPLTKDCEYEQYVYKWS